MHFGCHKLDITEVYNMFAILLVYNAQSFLLGMTNMLVYIEF